MSEQEPDYYDVLGVGKDATEADIQAAYRKASREAHPDREGGSHELMVLVNRAGDTLRDRLKRKRYDDVGASQAETSIASQGRDMMTSAFLAAALTDADDPLEAARLQLIQQAQEQRTLLENIAHRRAAVETRRKNLKWVKKRGDDEPDVLDRVLQDVLKSIATDAATAAKKMEALGSALAQLAFYRYHGSMEGWGRYPAERATVILGPSAAERNAAAAKFWEGR